VDLSKARGVEDLYRQLQRLGRPLQAAALNAGVGAGGAFVGEQSSRTSWESSI
jgi:hypothetical protein